MGGGASKDCNSIGKCDENPREELYKIYNDRDELDEDRLNAVHVDVGYCEEKSMKKYKVAYIRFWFPSSCREFREVLNRLPIARKVSKPLYC